MHDGSAMIDKRAFTKSRIWKAYEQSYRPAPCISLSSVTGPSGFRLPRRGIIQSGFRYRSRGPIMNDDPRRRYQRCGLRVK